MGQVRRRQFLVAACGLVAIPLVTEAQPSKRVARIGWLGWGRWMEASPPLFHLEMESLRSGLRERGWVDGDNLRIEIRSGDLSQARELTAELVRLKVDLIVAQGPMIFGAQAVASTMPLVFFINGDPIEAKLVASLSHPGANLTGITNLSAELSGKRLELLKETVPGITHVAAIANQTHPGVQLEFHANQAAAHRLGLTLKWFPVNAIGDIDAAFDAIARDGAQALVAIPDNMIYRKAKDIAEFAVKRRIPTISGSAAFAEAGNLMSYGPNLRGSYHQISVYVDKLLRGARPADLPVEQPTKLEFVVNLKAAKTIGLNIPQTVLLRADVVIR